MVTWLIGLSGAGKITTNATRGNYVRNLEHSVDMIGIEQSSRSSQRY